MEFKDILPYIITVACSLIAGISSYAASRRSLKTEIRAMEKQHTLDIEKEREKFAMEKEKMEIEHRHQLDLIQAQSGNQLGVDLISTMAKEYMKSPEAQAQMRNGANKRRRK